MSTMPQGMNGEEPNEEDEQISNFKKRSEIKKEKKNKSISRGKDWIQKKKERQRRQGKEVREDSKYTGRKRTGHGIY
jgi:18S rRNA (guanine1575-N7)-methyltransferase